MNNTEKAFLSFLFFIFIVALTIIVSGRIETCNSISQGYVKLIFENSEKAGALEECRKYNPFQQAVSKIGKISYSEEYNCLDHAKDILIELEKVDIKSFIAINKDRSHAVNIVLIDYNGQFVSPDDNFELLEVRNSEMQTICHK